MWYITTENGIPFMLVKANNLWRWTSFYAFPFYDSLYVSRTDALSAAHALEAYATLNMALHRYAVLYEAHMNVIKQNKAYMNAIKQK